MLRCQACIGFWHSQWLPRAHHRSSRKQAKHVWLWVKTMVPCWTSKIGAKWMFIQKQYGNAGLDIPKHQEHPVDVQGLRLSFQLLSTTNRATLPRWNIMGSRPKSAGLEGQLMKIDHQTGPEMCLRMSTCCTHTDIYIYTYIRICIMYIPVIYIYNSMLYTCIICVLCVHLSLSLTHLESLSNKVFIQWFLSNFVCVAASEP